ncbi:MAG: hypothetical protein ACR2NZ_19255, partial [Rubripirellula sp.]
LFTTYFWFVKARGERPSLQLFQLSDFRAVCRRHPEDSNLKRLCLQQLDTGGVLIVNHSTRQSSVVCFDCYLQTDRGEILGDWGYSGDDKPPWNVGPESTIAFSPACFFDLPEDCEVPEEPRFRIVTVTANGKAFSSALQMHAPRSSVADQVRRHAA